MMKAIPTTLIVKGDHKQIGAFQVFEDLLPGGQHALRLRIDDLHLGRAEGTAERSDANRLRIVPTRRRDACRGFRHPVVRHRRVRGAEKRGGERLGAARRDGDVSNARLQATLTVPQHRQPAQQSEATSHRDVTPRTRPRVLRPEITGRKVLATSY